MDNLYKGNTLMTKDEAGVLDIDPYLPSDKLIKAVQLAQILGRPLLVKGEPGCGKSRLAEAIAAELHREAFRSSYFEWNVRSTSKALEGLYTIDHLKRLRDAHLNDGAIKLDIKLSKDAEGNYQSDSPYLSLGVLGKAFQATWRKDARPPVVLIDEIDKADIDFPNDLLLELDRMEFSIPEAKGEDNKPVSIKANPKLKPVIIITSNDEKQLPAAFLRRCLFHYIDFSEIKFDEIVAAKFPALQQQGQTISKGVKAFLDWRTHIAKKASGVKNISTSELLDWFSLINYEWKEHGTIPEFSGSAEPPYAQVLLKEVESIQAFASTPASL